MSGDVGPRVLAIRHWVRTSSSLDFLTPAERAVLVYCTCAGVDGAEAADSAATAAAPEPEPEPEPEGEEGTETCAPCAGAGEAPAAFFSLDLESSTEKIVTGSSKSFYPSPFNIFRTRSTACHPSRVATGPFFVPG